MSAALDPHKEESSPGVHLTAISGRNEASTSHKQPDQMNNSAHVKSSDQMVANKRTSKVFDKTRRRKNRDKSTKAKVSQK